MRNQIVYNTAFSFGNEQLAAAESTVLALITIVGAVGTLLLPAGLICELTPRER